MFNKEMTDLSFQKGIFNLHQGEMCLGAIALIYFKNSLSKQSKVFLLSQVDKNIIVEILSCSKICRLNRGHDSSLTTQSMQVVLNIW